MAWNISEAEKQRRRKQLAAKFANLDFETFARIYRKWYARYSDVEWKIKAVEMAKSGRYQVVDIAAALNKTPENVCMAFSRIINAKPPLRSAWLPNHNTNTRFIIVDGQGYMIPTQEHEHEHVRGRRTDQGTRYDDSNDRRNSLSSL